MPRPTKAVRRQLINAAAEYKKGNRKEAYELWQKAANTRKERLAGKRNKNKKEGAAASAS
jgi:hypothetical protein